VCQQEEGVVAHALGDERGACGDTNFVHLGGEELQVSAAEAREERNLSEVVDSSRHRSFLYMERIVPCAATSLRFRPGNKTPGLRVAALGALTAQCTFRCRSLFYRRRMKSRTSIVRVRSRPVGETI